MNDVMKIVKSPKESCLSEGVSETTENESECENGGLLSTLIGTLGGTLLENMLAGTGAIRDGTGTIRAGYHQKKSSDLMVFIKGTINLK